jgi:hypothetical protein
MRPRNLLFFVITALFVLMSGCGTNSNCPVCGTTENGAYSIINIIPVPEHNPTGAPGGPFNSFDISWVDPVNHRFYVSDRIGLDIVVVDTIKNVALNAIGGDNTVAVPASQTPSPCVKDAGGNDIIPPLRSVDQTDFTRFGCRTAPPGGTAFSIPNFGASGDLGGFPGAQCCASRGNGVNPLSCPCGIVVTADGKTMFVGNASSSVVVFDLTTNPPTVIADIPTGQSPDFDALPDGVGPCIVSSAGRALSDPTCGDMRADEMSYDEKDKVLLVDNGDPGVPFITAIDVSHVVNRTGTVSQQHCLPTIPNQPYSFANPPTCILGQIWFDGAPTNSTGSCNVASSAPLAGISGVPCIHAPVAPAGLGGSAFNPNTGHFLSTLPNNGPDPSIGEVEEIDFTAFGTARPVITKTFPIKNCMPTSIVQGPGNNFLVGCADHDGVAFPPNEYVIDGTSGTILATIDKVGGVDEIWFNPGDNRYYLAARDMPGGPVLGVIDAKSNQWLMNAATNSNSHSVAVDPSNNHIFVPMQSGGTCGTQSQNGCIAVYARQ